MTNNTPDEPSELDIELSFNTAKSPPVTAPEFTAAARDVLAERRRQLVVLGRDLEHDEAMSDPGDIAAAACCYALNAASQLSPHAGQPLDELPVMWPNTWDEGHWNPKDARRDLVRAGALILAEIERMDHFQDRSEGRVQIKHCPKCGSLVSYAGTDPYCAYSDCLWNNGATAINGIAHTAISALRELVACKDIKDAIDNPAPNLLGAGQFQAEDTRLRANYARRKPLAWAAAREVLKRRTKPTGQTSRNDQNR